MQVAPGEVVGLIGPSGSGKSTLLKCLGVVIEPTAGRSNAESRKRAMELLEALDVVHRAKAMPSQLSGGEQQRVSIARALVNRPPVILADEPAAPLDSERALAVFRILNQMALQYETAIIVVTQSVLFSKYPSTC